MFQSHGSYGYVDELCGLTFGSPKLVHRFTFLRPQSYISYINTPRYIYLPRRPPFWSIFSTCCYFRAQISQPEHVSLPRTGPIRGRFLPGVIPYSMRFAADRSPTGDIGALGPSISAH